MTEDNLNTVGLGQRSTLADVLAVGTVRHEPALLAAAHVVGAVPLGEAPLVGAHDLLTTGELELGTAQSLNGVVAVHILGANGENALANGDTRRHLHGLTIRTSHTR